jgi:hypothetical protein
MRATQPFRAIVVVVLWSGSLLAQGTAGSAQANSADIAKNPWAYTFTLAGYLVPHETSYANPTFTADRHWLHLEARYNYEDLRTGSVWAGYNFSAGKKVVLNVTPIIGGVFGRTAGIAPGCEASLTYKRIELSISNEYVFDTNSKAGNFYYSWPQVTYSPVNWLRVGAVAQHKKPFQTSLDVQRGFLVGVSHKQMEFTTYVFDLGETDPSVALEVGVKF